MSNDPEFEAFQHLVWKALPKRKWLAGKDRVFDCIAILVQEWPDEQFAMADNGSTQQSDAIRGLTKTVKRHLHLVYGEHDFGFIWTIVLQALMYEMVLFILEWWRHRRENRMALLRWRNKWRGQEEE